MERNSRLPAILLAALLIALLMRWGTPIVVGAGRATQRTDRWTGQIWVTEYTGEIYPAFDESAELKRWGESTNPFLGDTRDAVIEKQAHSAVVARDTVTMVWVTLLAATLAWLVLAIVREREKSRVVGSAEERV